jgi:hypothetical protein
MNRCVIIFAALLVFTMACSDTDEFDEEPRICAAPPVSIYIKFVNSEGVNLLENGSITFNNVKVQEIKNDGKDYYQLLENKNDKIRVVVGDNIGTKQFQCSSPLIDFTFSVTVESSNTKPCNGYFVKDISSQEDFITEDTPFGIVVEIEPFN